MALPLKGYAPTAEEAPLLENVDVSIASEGGATVEGIPIGTDEYVMDRAMEVVRDGGAYHLARCLTDMPDRHAADLIAIESLGQRASYLKKDLDTRLSLRAGRRADNGAQWARVQIYPGASRGGVGRAVFPGGVPG